MEVKIRNTCVSDMRQKSSYNKNYKKLYFNKNLFRYKLQIMAEYFL